MGADDCEMARGHEIEPHTHRSEHRPSRNSEFGGGCAHTTRRSVHKDDSYISAHIAAGGWIFNNGMKNERNYLYS